MISRDSSRSLVFLVLVGFVGILNTAHCQPLFQEDAALDVTRAWKEFQEFREWQKSRNEWISQKVGGSSSVVPPPIDQAAQMARFIVNHADWTAVATMSTRSDMEGYPASSLVSVSDGPLGNGIGVPYMFLTPLDFTAKDLAKDPRASLMMTLDQTSYCKDKGMDPMDPRCARVYLSGKIVEVKPESSEYEVAKKAVFVRHPWLAHMPPNHHFYFAKLDIATIVVLDTFGGPKYVTVDDYLRASTTKPKRQNYWHRLNILDDNLSLESEEEKTALRV